MEDSSALTRQFLCFLAGFILGIFVIMWSVPYRQGQLMEMMEASCAIRLTSNITRTAVVSNASDSIKSNICLPEKFNITKENLAEFYDEFYKYYALNNEW